MSVVRRGQQQICERYRPRRLNELYGNESAVKSLYEMLSRQEDQRQKTYLFAGTRGAGKTSIAKILATGLNCQKGDTGDPCLECDNCKESLKNNAIFINEINCSKFTTKQDMFKLSEQFNDFPCIGRNNIFILDEIQSLSNMSQNLLLKSFENPPKNTYFFLCTTEPQKIIQTIHDRCAEFLFRPPTYQNRLHLLTDIFKQENWGDKLSKQDKITLIKALNGFSYRKIIKATQQVVIGGIQALKDIMDIPMVSQKQEEFSIARRIMDTGFYRPTLSQNNISAQKLYSECLDMIAKIDKYQPETLRRILLSCISKRIIDKKPIKELSKMRGIIQVLQKPYFETDGCISKSLIDLFDICKFARGQK